MKAKPGKHHRRSDCPISFSLDFFGDKWSLLVLRDLVFFGKRNYGQFLESDENIATNILSDRLQRLEQDGFITKQVDPDNRRKFVYCLAEKGLDAIPILLELILWGAKHDPETAAPKEFIKELKRNKNRMAKQFRANARLQGKIR